MKSSEKHAQPCQAFWNRQQLPLLFVAVSGQAVSEAVKILSNTRATVGWTETCCVYCSTVIAWNSPLIALVEANGWYWEHLRAFSLCVRECVESWRTAWKMRLCGLTGWMADWSFHLRVCVWGNWALTESVKLSCMSLMGGSYWYWEMWFFTTERHL